MILEEIKNGWAAHGDGWAVHAPTRDEAILRFAEAERRHERIAKQPPFYEQETFYERRKPLAGDAGG